MCMNELETKVNNLRELRRMADELAAEIAATPTIWEQFTKQTTIRRFIVA